MKQKFRRGDLVYIAQDLGPSMAHFRSGVEAIVINSYAELYGGNDTFNYAVIFCDTGYECSWYHEHQLGFLRSGCELEIERLKFERKEREKEQTDLTWIVRKWPEIREKVPGASMEKLMRLVNITNPWGDNGEGITYYHNAVKTFRLLDPVLSTGNVEQVESFIAEHNKLMQAETNTLRT